MNSTTTPSPILSSSVSPTKSALSKSEQWYKDELRKSNTEFINWLIEKGYKDDKR